MPDLSGYIAGSGGLKPNTNYASRVAGTISPDISQTANSPDGQSGDMIQNTAIMFARRGGSAKDFMRYLISSGIRPDGPDMLDALTSYQKYLNYFVDPRQANELGKVIPTGRDVSSFRSSYDNNGGDW